MALNLYRRHGSNCVGKRALHETTYEGDESRRSWRKCLCPIYASGTIGGKFKRKNTERVEWSHAKGVVAEWEKAPSWDGAPPLERPAPPERQPSRITIDRALTTFFHEFQQTAAPATQKKYRLMLGNFRKFSEQHGYVMIDQWGPADVREFRSSWRVSAQTAARRMSVLKVVFEYCLSNEWIDRNPARIVKNPRGRDAADRRNEQKLPFTDEEIRRMYDACPKYGTEPRYKWTGEDVADFISISIYTGLRISDVAIFDIDRMQPTGEIRIRATKAGTHVYTWVPQWLQDRIRARAVQHGSKIFGDHTTKNLDVITELWRRKLNRVWEICGPWKVKPTPHRFRHTFARILLERGVSVRDLAELLGNTEQIVRKHYSAWVTERQDRLTQVLKEAFEGKPKPKLVAMQSR
jgi:integrase/recombinase XerC